MTRLFFYAMTKRTLDPVDGGPPPVRRSLPEKPNFSTILRAHKLCEAEPLWANGNSKAYFHFLTSQKSRFIHTVFIHFIDCSCPWLRENNPVSLIRPSYKAMEILLLLRRKPEINIFFFKLHFQRERRQPKHRSFHARMGCQLIINCTVCVRIIVLLFQNGQFSPRWWSAESENMLAWATHVLAREAILLTHVCTYVRVSTMNREQKGSQK